MSQVNKFMFSALKHEFCFAIFTTSGQLHILHIFGNSSAERLRVEAENSQTSQQIGLATGPRDGIETVAKKHMVFSLHCPQTFQTRTPKITSKCLEIRFGPKATFLLLPLSPRLLPRCRNSWIEYREFCVNDQIVPRDTNIHVLKGVRLCLFYCFSEWPNTCQLKDGGRSSGISNCRTLKNDE